ncbi:hypothetical protein BaRGS_00005213 [Batillaria attramentaria]|uniref:G-protein coupled receptors family 1 profile domain-containing protein n=1 Tax=Batillaria attramentaria TaxID=370345 RepID=A0ABD0LVL4_9CAEN
MREAIVVTSVELGLGAVSNLVLIFVLAWTWKQWRQVRWYVVLLTVGNVLEIFFTLGVEIGRQMTLGFWLGSAASCKFLMFMHSLGPSMANMAVAALSLHVLLTSMSGNQGNRLRHTLVIGLFLFLSFPVPISKIPAYMLETPLPWITEHKKCVPYGFLDSPGAVRSYHVIAAFAVLFFPQIIFFLSCAVTLIHHLTRSQGTDKGDVSYADLIFSGVLGIVMVTCCLPYGVFVVYSAAVPNSDHLKMEVIEKDLTYLMFTNPTVSAIVCVVFGTVQASRKHYDANTPSIIETNEAGETRKLFN